MMSKADSVFIHLKEKTVKLTFQDFEDEIDVDELTSINYSNLYGEAVTVSALMNKVGIFKAEAEAAYEEGKLDLSIYEAEKRKELRREAAANSGKIKISEDETLKLTEKALDEIILLDKGWQIKKKNVIFFINLKIAKLCHLTEVNLKAQSLTLCAVKEKKLKRKRPFRQVLK